MTKLMRLAVRPWHPERHYLFPRQLQPRVILVLLLQLRLERRAAQHARQPQGPRTRQQRRLEAALNARAPADVWLNFIVPFLPRMAKLR